VSPDRHAAAPTLAVPPRGAQRHGRAAPPHHRRLVLEGWRLEDTPNEHAWTRITELKWLTGQEHSRTTTMTEYPEAEGDPYYPVPTQAAAALARRYAERAAATPDVYFVGRLGTYRYYNMDQCVAQALTLFARIAGELGMRVDGLAGAVAAGR
jgi:hypothetical protein